MLAGYPRMGVATVVLACASVASAQALPAPEPRFSLTVYSTADPATFDPRSDSAQQVWTAVPRTVPGYGIVRETRPIELAAGVNLLRFTDVASGIDPTTVSFLSLTDPAGTAVLEQNYEYDLVSPAKLLQRYVDKHIFVERPVGDGKTETLDGVLLSAGPGQVQGQGIVLKSDDGQVHILQSYSGIRVADAGGLITKPTLVWQLTAAKAGKQDAQVTYQTAGLTWRADYNIVLNAANTAADVGAWVTLVNRSGAAYPDTRLKLIAGDVQRVTPPEQVRRPTVMAAARMQQDNAPAGGFEEKSLFEYHLYTLGRTTSIPDNSTKQIELFEKKLDVPVKKIFVYYGLAEPYRTWFAPSALTDRNIGTETNKKVDVYIAIDNKQAAGLGIPLPAGRVRVSQRDDDAKTEEFVGEDVIRHTPKDETVQVKLGSAFDLVGERKQTAFTITEKKRTLSESFEIKVKNHKKEAVRVIVKENLFRWTNWEITDKSDAFEKQDYRTVHFPVDVPADGEKVVTYTVRYTW